MSLTSQGCKGYSPNFSVVGGPLLREAQGLHERHMTGVQAGNPVHLKTSKLRTKYLSNVPGILEGGPQEPQPPHLSPSLYMSQPLLPAQVCISLHLWRVKTRARHHTPRLSG